MRKVAESGLTQIGADVHDGNRAAACEIGHRPGAFVIDVRRQHRLDAGRSRLRRKGSDQLGEPGAAVVPSFLQPVVLTLEKMGQGGDANKRGFAVHDVRHCDPEMVRNETRERLEEGTEVIVACNETPSLAQERVSPIVK